MSLLIDALKKAEQSRRDASDAGSAGDNPRADDLRLSSLEAPGVEPMARPTLALLEEDLAPAPPREAAPPAPEARTTARQIFEARRPPPRRLVLPLAAAGGLLAACFLGAYVWWQMQPQGLGTKLTGGNPPQARAAAPLTVAPPAALPLARPDGAEASQSLGEPPSRGRLPPPAAPPSPAPLPALRRTESQDAVPAVLAEAYGAYGKGDLERASRLYAEALGQDPYNQDALNGRGAIALRQGQPQEAEAWFRQSLRANPQDPVALAGLAGLRDRLDPAQAESRLKTQLAGQPDGAAAHFALGNALAAQGRWSEAQQAYFQAHRLEPGNPDYLFNLAVSLDQLHQPALARQYYEKAMGAAAGAPAAFDPAAARARIEALAAAPAP
ncbi:MAG: tetratricopeptide repeat protein [Rhodocyclaceae bacterium]|jgi:tetratricopeptide (TPR) repeat protein|nr:tetratricopeptide repeat protein [Rhodocyclaceae bacterium]